MMGKRVHLNVRELPVGARQGFKESSYLALMRCIQWGVSKCIDVDISRPGVMTELGGRAPG
jgi:hypothetical protein